MKKTGDHQLAENWSLFSGQVFSSYPVSIDPMRRHVCSLILKDPVGLEKMEAMAQSQRHLSTHIPPSPSARHQPWGSVPTLATAETRSKNRQGLWTSGPVIPFLSSVAVRRCGRQSLASAAETNEGSGFPSGGCREKGVQSCDAAGEPGSCCLSAPPSSGHGTSSVPGSSDHHFCPPGRQQGSAGGERGARLRSAPELSARSSGRSLPPRGSGTLSPVKPSVPFPGKQASTGRTAAGSATVARVPVGMAGLVPHFILTTRWLRRPAGPVESHSAAAGVMGLAPSSRPLLENEEHGRQRLSNICGPTAGVSRGQLPAGRPTGRLGAAALRAPCHPLVGESSTALASAQLGEQMGRDSAQLPEQPRGKPAFPPCVSRGYGSHWAPASGRGPAAPDSLARTVPLPACSGGQREDQRVRGFLRQRGGRAWVERPTGFTFPCAGRASLVAVQSRP